MEQVVIRQLPERMKQTGMPGYREHTHTVKGTFLGIDEVDGGYQLIANNPIARNWLFTQSLDTVIFPTLHSIRQTLQDSDTTTVEKNPGLNESLHRVVMHVEGKKIVLEAVLGQYVGHDSTQRDIFNHFRIERHADGYYQLWHRPQKYLLTQILTIPRGEVLVNQQFPTLRSCVQYHVRHRYTFIQRIGLTS